MEEEREKSGEGGGDDMAVPVIVSRDESVKSEQRRAVGAKRGICEVSTREAEQ